MLGIEWSQVQNVKNVKNQTFIERFQNNNQ